MTCRLSSDKSKVSTTKMRDGELAVVVDWPGNPHMTGVVIQRLEGDALIVVGGPVRKGFSTGAGGRGLVRILEPGETMIVGSYES